MTIVAAKQASSKLSSEVETKSETKIAGDLLELAILQKRVAICCICCILLGIGVATGRHSAESARLKNIGRSIPKSRAGQEIGGTCIDPFMNWEEERALRDKLDVHDATSWVGWRLMDLIVELENKLPTFVDYEELSLCGIDANTRIADVPPASLLRRLDCVLRPLDLTVELRAGCLEITTLDAADANPPLRAYDVSPLVNHTGIDGLHDSITMNVAPDSWLRNGGQSTITLAVTRSQFVLFVSAPTRTQLQVEALLDTMNQSEAFQFRSVNASATQAIAHPAGLKQSFGCWSGFSGSMGSNVGY